MVTLIVLNCSLSSPSILHLGLKDTSLPSQFLFHHVITERIAFYYELVKV